jgi:hypothetical protein
MEVIALILVIAGFIAAPMIVAFVAVETRNGGIPRTAWAVVGLSIPLSAVPLSVLVLSTGVKFMNWTDAAVVWPLAFSVTTGVVAGARCIARAAVKRRRSHAA